MKGAIKDINLELGGGITVTLSLPRPELEAIYRLKESPVDVTIKKYREKRSLSANGYAWQLMTQIAQKMETPTTKEEVYDIMLKRYGQCGLVTIQKDKAEQALRAFDHWEVKGEGTTNGKEFIHVMVYVGSSQYDTKEMSIFIEGIVDEAKALDIETMTPQELAMLEGMCG